MENNKKKRLISAVFSLADTWLRDWMQKLADKIPGDSILRNRIVESVIAMLKGYIEVWIEELPPTIAVPLEKIIDSHDFLTGALGDKHPVVATTKKMVEEFVSDTFRRLKEAENPEAELELVGQEFKTKSRERADWFGKIVNEIVKADEKAASAIQDWRGRQTWVKKGR